MDKVPQVGHDTVPSVVNNDKIARYLRYSYVLKRRFLTASGVITPNSTFSTPSQDPGQEESGSFFLIFMNVFLSLLPVAPRFEMMPFEVLKPYIFFRPFTSCWLGFELGWIKSPFILVRTFCFTPLTVLPPALLGSGNTCCQQG